MILAAQAVQRLRYNAVPIGCTINILGIVPSLLGLCVLSKLNRVDELMTSGSK